MKRSFGLVFVILALVVLGCELPFEITRKDSSAPAPTPEATATSEPEEMVSTAGKSEEEDEKSKLEDRIAELEKKLEKKPTAPAATKKPVKQKKLDPGYMRVNSPGDGWLALRSGPNSGSRLLAKMPHGTAVHVGSCGPRVVSGRLTGRWCRVEYGNLSGWSFDYYLKP